MPKSIIFETAQIAVSYDNRYMYAKIKGVEGVFSQPPYRINELPTEAQNFILGKRRRAAWKRACAARNWDNPVELFLKRQLAEEEQEKERIAAMEDAKNKAAEIAEQHARVVEFLSSPNQEKREKVLRLHVQLHGILQRPNSFITRKECEESIEIACYWGRMFDEFSKSPIGLETPITRRAYMREEFRWSAGSLVAPEWVHQWEEYVRIARERLAVLESYV